MYKGKGVVLKEIVHSSLKCKVGFGRVGMLILLAIHINNKV